MYLNVRLYEIYVLTGRSGVFVDQWEPALKKLMPLSGSSVSCLQILGLTALYILQMYKPKHENLP